MAIAGYDPSAVNTGATRTLATSGSINQGLPPLTGPGVTHAVPSHPPASFWNQ